jgi:hypothetical protein
VAIFMDVELVGIDDAEYPDAFTVVFDAIYAGETWCRSLVWVEADFASHLARDEHAIINAARDALVDLLAAETVPVSLQLRLGSGGSVLLARGTPGGAPRAQR